MNDDATTVIRVINREFWANSYIVRGSKPGTCFLIDPGLDEAAIRQELQAAMLTPIAIFLTHGHFDHLASAEHFRREFAIEVYLHDADRKVASRSNFLMMAFGMRTRITPPEVRSVAGDGVVLSTGDDCVEVVHAPGHTPGSAVVVVNGHAFTGDTVYRDDIWLTSLPEQDQAVLRTSVETLWTSLADGTPVYPGHGASSTFGQIKRTNLPLRRLLGKDESAT